MLTCCSACACRIAELASRFHSACSQASAVLSSGQPVPDMQSRMRRQHVMYYGDCELQALHSKGSKGGASEGSGTPGCLMLVLRSGHEKSAAYRYGTACRSTTLLQ